MYFDAGVERLTIGIPIITTYKWGKGAHFFVKVSNPKP